MLPAQLARRRLLARRDYSVEVVGMTKGPRAALKQLSRGAYREMVPYVFVDHRPVGGFDDLKTLDRSGDLERLVRGAP